MNLQPLSRMDDGAIVNERVNVLITGYNRLEQDQFIPTYAADTGSSTAYAMAPVPGVKAYVVGQRFVFKATNANTTTTPTLSVNGLTAGTIKWGDGTALAVGDIAAGAIVEVVVQATTPVFYLQTGLSSSAVTALVAAGSVRQIVSTSTGAVATGSTALPFDNTIPQNTEGDQYQTLTITPKSSTSILIIWVVWNGANTTGSETMTLALFQDSTANALAAVAQNQATASGITNFSLVYKMTSGTTSATTFKVRVGTNGGSTVTFNGVAAGQRLGGAMLSSMTIMEVGA